MYTVLISTIIITIFTGLLTIESIWCKESKIRKYRVVSYAIVIIIFGIVIASVNFRENKKEKNDKMKTANEGGLDSRKSHNKFVILSFGSNIFRLERQKLNSGIPINPFILFNETSPSIGVYADINFKIVKNRIYVSGLVKSFDKKIIAKIEDNEWKLNPNEYFDRNYDNNGLEIFDKYEIPVFQLDIRNSDTIIIGGAFFNDEGILIVGDIGVGLAGIPTINKYKDCKKYFTPMFRYPSTIFFSERNYTKTNTEFLEKIKNPLPQLK